ncbi:solute carrier family 15 member 1b isoform X1 [Alosa alosa]|uniref:solute carrier family 15 member 1b isoform X1 n=2 Tax=Alosa alosa TaxID=278164 RepID=UPI0020154372|nr:solute carrier family 15 member 1b isoform X1 [Alosa alosa]
MADKEMGMETKKKKSVEVCGYPLSIFFIVVNEFCERFSYYGMRAVLVLYFTYFLRWDENTAISIYHTFVALCYLTPILGAIVADSWLGKFKTIVYLSIVYTLGQAVLAVSAIHDLTDNNRDGIPDNLTLHVALSMVGLALIALGTGGIKPCVAAFGGDQFDDSQEKQRSTFFSIFYLSINAGSLLSTIITPILRAQECGIHTVQKCYPLAFGVPAALMMVALIVFIVGSKMYIKVDPKGNIMLEVCKCIGFALKNRFKHRSSQYPSREHWMDWAEDKYGKLLIAQIKMVLKVLFLYIPLPMFWALFDQQGSRWTLQATTMDGNFGLLVIQPDQMQMMNPIMILIMVPIVDSLVYPLIKKCGLNFTPLKRMTVGMLMAGLAFAAAGVVQLQIDNTLPKFPSATQSQVKLINMQNNQVTGTIEETAFTLPAYAGMEDYITTENDTVFVTVGSTTNNISLVSHMRQTVLLFPTDVQTVNDSMSKPQEGKNAVRFVNAFNKGLNVSWSGESLGFITTNSISSYTLVPQGNVVFTILDQTGATCEMSQDLSFGSSVTYTIPSTFSISGAECAASITKTMEIQPNVIHMAWQLPQYFLMTAGEVVFSVTGLEFSYSQAPSNMKSVLQAGWLLTVAVGNIIVLIIAEAATISEKWAEYILFASLLVAVCVVFSIMAYFYTYMDPAEIEAQFAEKDPEDKDEKKRGSLSSSSSSSGGSEGGKAEEDVQQTKI